MFIPVDEKQKRVRKIFPEPAPLDRRPWGSVPPRAYDTLPGAIPWVQPLTKPHSPEPAKTFTVTGTADLPLSDAAATKRYLTEEGVNLLLAALEAEQGLTLEDHYADINCQKLDEHLDKLATIRNLMTKLKTL